MISLIATIIYGMLVIAGICIGYVVLSFIAIMLMGTIGLLLSFIGMLLSRK